MQKTATISLEPTDAISEGCVILINTSDYYDKHRRIHLLFNGIQVETTTYDIRDLPADCKELEGYYKVTVK